MQRASSSLGALVGVITLMLAGCVVIPAGKGTVLDGEPVSEGQLDFLDDPATRQAEVENRLGQPDLVWAEARVYAYHWEIVDGVAVWALPFPGGYGGSVGATGLSSKYVLLIQFDEASRVLRHESRKRPVFDSYGEMIREWVAEDPEPAKPD